IESNGNFGNSDIDHAVDLIGVGNSLINSGDVTGDCAVLVSGTGNVITNSGTLTGNSGGLGAIYLMSDVAAVNTIHHPKASVIAGATTAILSVTGKDIVDNAGTIDGNVALGSGDDQFDTHLGVVHGTISLDRGNDSFIGSKAGDKVIGGIGADDLTGGL